MRSELWRFISADVSVVGTHGGCVVYCGSGRVTDLSGFGGMIWVIEGNVLNAYNFGSSD